MTLTWQQLRDLKLSELDDAADGWGKVSNRAHAAHVRAENEMAGSLAKTQRSESATAAVGRIKQLERNFDYMHIECGLVRTALNGLSSELSGAQRKLKNALEDAAGLKFTVESDGSVTYPVDRQKENTGTPDPNQKKAQGIAQDIADALKQANETDGRYSRAIARLKAPPGLAVTDAMMADAAGDKGAVQSAARKFLPRPRNKSPKANKKWWDSLTKEQREEYKATYPGLIGALDGIPSADRDDANRMVLDETRGQTQTEYDRLMQHEPQKYGNSGDHPGTAISPAWQKWNSERRQLMIRLKGMNAIQARFNGTVQSGLPRAYLLGFDTKDRGHAILANGNPDTAKNTAVYVPGITNNLGTMGDLSGRSDRLWQAGHAQDPNSSTSTITWMGYDPPQSFTDANTLDNADAGAPKLNRFLHGLQTAQGGPQASHTTLIGHSYGTTTIGAAANAAHAAAARAGHPQDWHMDADDIVVAGSPGMPVHSANDLGVDRQHVYAEHAGNDPIPEIGQTSGAFGNSPYASSFGAHQLSADHGPLGLKAHSSYWDAGSQGLKNQAAVITGQHQHLRYAKFTPTPAHPSG
jgi:hypothetical protein